VERDVLTPVVPDAIWFSERPIWFSGVRLRSRTTVIRLEDGGLFVHSPPDPAPEWCAAVDGLGDVRWLVVPNCFHHLGAPASAARYPAATLVGPRSAVDRNSDLELGLEINDDAFRSALREFDVIPFRGCPFLDETVFFHRPTGTLVAADLVISATPCDHWTWRWAGRLTGCYQRTRVPPDVRKETRPSDEAARSIERLAVLPAERLLVAHADPIEDQPLERIADAWRFATKSTHE
jgi:hypothetical protein